MDEMEIESETIFLLENGDKICRVCLDCNQNNQQIFYVNGSDPENSNGLDLVKKLIVQGGIKVDNITLCMFIQNREQIKLYNDCENIV